MSMLAERKRKTKWILNPTKKPLWTTDSSGIKFGKDLMEKMGWSAGKGLGSKEQGMQEPLKVSYKNDTKGIGFKGNDNDWIEQQDEFNSLLSNLRSSDDTAGTSEIIQPEVKSLEHKSKHSRARVHYQKFVRGKDLSKYSDKDLACILGTSKPKKEKPEPEEGSRDSCNNDYETSFGVTTINSGSIQDYFKKKWTNNKTKCGALPETNEEAPNNPNESLPDSDFLSAKNKEENETPVAEEKQHKKKKHKSHPVSIECEATENLEDCQKSNEIDFPQTESERKKNRKRKHKSKTELESVEAEETSQIDNNKENERSKASETGSEEEPKRKKKKKTDDVNKDTNRKKECLSSTESYVLTENNTFEREEKKSKKKKNKLNSGSETGEGGKCSEVNEVDFSVEENERIQKKKNKDSSEKKNKVKKERTHSDEVGFSNQTNDFCRNEESNLSIQVESEQMSEMSEKKAKKRKNKSKSDAKELEFGGNEEEIEIGVKKSKKKKRKSEAGEEGIQVCEADELESSRKERKKNKKKNLCDEENELGNIEKKTAEDSEIVLSNENEVNSFKKKKKKKKNEKSEILEANEENLEKAPKINLIQYNNNEETENQSLDDSSIESSAHKVKKKKEKREKRREDENAGTDEGDATVPRKRKKSKKSEKAEECRSERSEEQRAGVSESDLGAKNGEGVASERADEVQDMKEPLKDKSVSEPVQYKSYTKQKVLDLICWADIKEFRGSNLGNVLGYGFKKEYLKSHEVR